MGNAITIRENTFNYCSSLTHINLPQVKVIEGYAFQYCENLISVHLPMLETLNSMTFSECNNLAVISLPLIKTLTKNSFVNCSLKTLNLPQLVEIEADALNYYDELEYLIIDDKGRCAEINRLIQTLPEGFKNIEIVSKSKQINSLCSVQRVLNHHLGQDISSHILNFSKQLGFFKQSIFVETTNLKQEKTFFDNCSIQ